MATKINGVSVCGLAVDASAELFHSGQMAARIARAQAAIAQALSVTKRPYLAVSGGKDSIVVTALAHTVRENIPILWSDGELEYPETVAYMSALHEIGGDQVIIAKGHAQHAGWFTPWQDRPFWRDPVPGAHRGGRDMDDWMASRGHDLTILGTRAGESRKRRDWLRRVAAEHGTGGLYPVRSGTGLRCCPIWDWTDDHVWALIGGWRLAYNAAYDRLAEIGAPRHRQRIGPLPLARRDDLLDGWPELLDRLEARYGRRWD